MQWETMGVQRDWSTAGRGENLKLRNSLGKSRIGLSDVILGECVVLVPGLVVGGIMLKSHVAFTMGWARWVVHLPSASHHGFHCLDPPSSLSKSSCLARGWSALGHA